MASRFSTSSPAGAGTVLTSSFMRTDSARVSCGGLYQIRRGRRNKAVPSGTRPCSAGELLPGEVEAREVLAQAVRVVDRGALPARDREQLAARLGERARAAAHAHDFRELRAIEAIQLHAAQELAELVVRRSKTIELDP